MKIFDCHTHIEQGFDTYDLSGVSNKNVIFNSIESYQKHRQLVSSSDVVSLIIDLQQTDFVLQEVHKGHVNGLKIHSRDQRLTDGDYAYLLKNLSLFPDYLPVILDAFYYGDEIQYQPSLTKIIEFAKFYPQKKFVIAHSGGYEVLKYFFHLRPLKNIYYDLSFSLQYLSDTSCFSDLKKLIKFTDTSRVMFGTDFFWASPKLQLEVLDSIFSTINLSIQDQHKILYDNARHIFMQFENSAQ
jgi:hypothetical protein